MLTATERIEDFKEVTEAEKAVLEALDAQWQEPPKWFIDLWNAACKTWAGSFGGYNENTGYFELNGITDIDYAEALIIYDAGHADVVNGYYYFGYGYKGRTNLPLWNAHSHGGATNGKSPIAHSSKSLEVLNLSTMVRGDQTHYQPMPNGKVATHCPNLHTILGEIELCYIGTKNYNIFAQCPQLKFVEFYFVSNAVFSLQDCPLLDISVFKQIANSNQSINSTITVHPNVYAKLTGDTTNAAAAALTSDELGQWMALLPAAAEKNIQFITI